MTSQIPRIYRGVFTYFDPPCAAWGAYMCLFTRDYLLDTFFLDSHAGTRDAAHDLLLYHQAGALLGVITLQVGLLRYTNDIRTWKVVQAAVLCIDLALLVGTAEVFGKQGRLSPFTWRAADWVGMVITIGVTIARVSFIAGVGLKEGGKRKEA